MIAAFTDKCNENAQYNRDRGGWGRAAWFAWQALQVDPRNSRAWRHLVAAGLRRGA